MQELTQATRVKLCQFFIPGTCKNARSPKCDSRDFCSEHCRCDSAKQKAYYEAHKEKYKEHFRAYKAREKAKKLSPS